MSFCQNMYNFHGHMNMLNDENRMSFYYNKICKNHNINNKICCDLGAGTGILSLFAILAGATHVYIVENQLNMIDIIKNVMELHDITTDKYTILQGWSTDITLPEKVDVIIHELIGEWGNGEQGLTYVSEFKTRNLKDGGQIIPDIIEVHLTLQHTNELYHIKYKELPFLQEIKLNKIFDKLNDNNNQYNKYGIVNKQYNIVNNDSTYISDTCDCNVQIVQYDLINDSMEEIKNKHIDLRFKPNNIRVISLLSTLKYYCSNDINTYGDTYTNHGNWAKQAIYIYPCNIDSDSEITGYIDMKNNPRNRCSQTIEISLTNVNKNILYTKFQTSKGFDCK